MARIFVSYRRSPSREIAREIAVILKKQFGGCHVFFDRQGIEAGNEWDRKIRGELEACEVLIPVIDVTWHGDPRLHDEKDWVRREVETVLRRNASTGPGQAPLVCILPVLVDPAKMPDPQGLPESLRPLCSWQGCDCSADPERVRDTVDKLIPKIEEHFGELPTGDVGLQVFSLPPRATNTEGFRFRYRAVRRREDLEPFVRFSDQEIEICDAHPGLLGDKRRELYETWCQWTATRDDIPWDDHRNKIKSFLILDRQSPGEVWMPISVSIILPLSPAGEEFLTKPPPGTKVNAVALKEYHLTRGMSSCLLIDTWITGQRKPGQKPTVRFQHHNWGTCLIMRHLAEFWDPDGGHFLVRLWNFLVRLWKRGKATHMTFLVEPDNHKLDNVLRRDIRFLLEPRNSECESILVLHYPALRNTRQQDYAAGIERLLGTFRRCRKIEIVREP